MMKTLVAMMKIMSLMTIMTKVTLLIKMMKVDENVHGATCISDAVFMQMMITLIIMVIMVNHGN